MTTATANGWAVIDESGLRVRTVCDTRRGAIVNWLVTERKHLIRTYDGDHHIELLWQHYSSGNGAS